MSGSKPQYTRKQVLAAVRKATGNLSVAAKLLGCSRQTVYNASLRWKTVRAEIASQREKVVDLAEQKLIEKLKASEWPAIKYVLSTLGKNRGYGPEVEAITAVEFIVKYDNDSDRDPPTKPTS